MSKKTKIEKIKFNWRDDLMLDLLAKFNCANEEQIKKYIDSGLYKGKAGAYGIQDGFCLVKEYSGSLNNVIGFPTEKIFRLLDEIIKK